MVEKFNMILCKNKYTYMNVITYMFRFVKERNISTFKPNEANLLNRIKDLWHFSSYNSKNGMFVAKRDI
jgi:hypothetical protein